LKAKLLLEDGTVIEGIGFGSECIRVGELVFTTGMVGYPEAMTDPSFKGQILIFTHPMIGNYGVPDKNIKEYGIPIHFESDKIQVEGIVISKLTRPNHWASKVSLDEWMRREGVPGIERVDTRALVRKIRERGVMKAVIAVGDYSISEMRTMLKEWNYDSKDFVSEVSPKEKIIHEPNDWTKTVVLIDCGVKFGILRELLKRKIRVIRVPPSSNFLREIDKYEADGVVISNGPGNPEVLDYIINRVGEIIEMEIPTLGICLGNQILALADGAKVFKLKYGHRGQNKPVVDLKTKRSFVTSQNHGYAILLETLNNFDVWMINADDKTVEAILHKRAPIIATQFHPEASPGPYDSTWIFDYFLRLMENGNGR